MSTYTRLLPIGEVVSRASWLSSFLGRKKQRVPATPETLLALGLRPPGGNEELIEITRHDTLESWPAQLRLAIRDRRLEDIEAIASVREPRQMVVRHVSTATYRSCRQNDSGGFALETTEQAFHDELLPISQLTSATSCRPLRRLPKPGSWLGRRLARRLLREPYEFDGSSLFWVDDLETLKLLEGLGADSHDPGWMEIPLLVHAAQRGLHDVVRFLVEERGHSPNAAPKNGGYSALHWAAELETVQYLIERGADACALTTWGDSVVAQQLRSDHVAIVDYLLSLGEERASRAQLLHWLSAQPEMLRVLILHRVPLAEPVERRLGERHRALPLQRVLRAGLDEYTDCPDVVQRETITNRLVECTELLLESGADSHVRDCANLLPCHLVHDAISDARDPMRRRLDALLAFDGRREEPPATPRCTCGLKL